MQISLLANWKLAQTSEICMKYFMDDDRWGGTFDWQWHKVVQGRRTPCISERILQMSSMQPVSVLNDLMSSVSWWNRFLCGICATLHHFYGGNWFGRRKCEPCASGGLIYRRNVFNAPSFGPQLMMAVAKISTLLRPLLDCVRRVTTRIRVKHSREQRFRFANWRLFINFF